MGENCVKLLINVQDGVVMLHKKTTFLVFIMVKQSWELKLVFSFYFHFKRIR